VEEEEHDGATKSAAAETVPATDGGEAAADVEALAGVSPVAPSCFRLPFLAVVFVSFAGAIPAPPHLLVLTYVEHASAESSRRRLRVLPWVRAPLAPRVRRFGGRLGCPGTTSTTSPSPSTTASATATTARPTQVSFGSSCAFASHRECHR
jgi:hypothetical protein